MYEIFIRIIMKKFLKYEEVSIDQTTGLAPVISYEPWVLRSIESVKQALMDGNPVLIRLHSAASYPCENEEDNYKLDLESHAVLIIGYDDDEQSFDVVDPWNGTKGNKRGIYKLPYEVYPIVCVNSSLSKDTVFTSLKMYANEKQINNKSFLEIKYGFYVPKGYIIDQNNTYLTNVQLEINYTAKGKEYNNYLEIDGEFKIGEYAIKEIPIPENLNETIIFNINAKSIINGERPYCYKDEIITKYTVTKKINNLKDEKEKNIKSKKFMSN